MVKEASESVPRCSARCQSGSIPPDNAGSGWPQGGLGCSSEATESRAVPVVVLVEQCDETFGHVAECFAIAGFRVARARNSVQAITSQVRESADLLVINADRTMETAWLLAAKLRLTHPEARIWVYIRRPSTFDIDAANLLEIEELIEHGGKAPDLQMQVLDRLGVSAEMKVPRSGSPTGVDPVETAA